MGIAVSMLIAFAATLILEPVVIRQMIRRGVIDQPGTRSSHTVPTPRGGGIAIVAGALAGALVSGSNASFSLAVVLASATVLAAVGYADDSRSLAASWRLGAQLVVGTVAGLLLLGNSWWALGALAVGLWVSTYTNAFNFMDGINGISGLNVVVVGGNYLLVGWWYNVSPIALLGGLMVATSLGFLPFNLVRPRVFLGDVGSYFYGCLIALTAVAAAVAGVPVAVLIGPLVIYLADTGTTLAKRRMSGARLSEPHRSHAYQRSLGVFWGHGHSALWTALCATATAAGGWIASLVSVPAGAACVGLFVALYLLTPRWSAHVGGYLARLAGPSDAVVVLSDRVRADPVRRRAVSKAEGRRTDL